MPKSRKRKGAHKYRPDPRVKRKMDPVETVVKLRAKADVAGILYREAMISNDPEELKSSLTKLKDMTDEVNSFAGQPLRAMVGPSENKAKY